jgi:hypothetical protein
LRGKHAEATLLLPETEADLWQASSLVMPGKFASSKPISEFASLLLSLLIFIDWLSVIDTRIGWNIAPVQPSMAEVKRATCDESVHLGLLLLLLSGATAARLGTHNSWTRSVGAPRPQRLPLRDPAAASQSAAPPKTPRRHPLAPVRITQPKARAAARARRAKCQSAVMSDECGRRSGTDYA